MPFGIQICSGTEWSAVKPLLGASENTIGRFPYGEFFRVEISGRECVLFHSRRTKTRAAGACQYAIDHWNIDPLLVIGTCGGVAEHLAITDLILADRTFQYDSQDRRPEMGYMVRADLSWLRPEAFGEAFHVGAIATADRDLTFVDLEMLRNENVLGADWESGAIAMVCSLNRIGWATIRGVSDIPLREGAADAARQISDYRRHTPAIMGKLLGLLPKIIASMAA
jgi:nucleoside phosphorylase